MKAKLIPRFPYYPQVDRYTNVIGPLLAHIRVYSETERDMVRSAFTVANEAVYKNLRNELLAVAPPKETATIDDFRRHNDSVHHLRELYKRFLTRLSSPDLWH
jgi:hypothetical protein